MNKFSFVRIVNDSKVGPIIILKTTSCGTIKKIVVGGINIIPVGKLWNFKDNDYIWIVINTGENFMIAPNSADSSTHIFFTNAEIALPESIEIDCQCIKLS